jgi:hypothetical protein
MANRFLYFLPGPPGANSKMLQERGLLDRFSLRGGRCIEHTITEVMQGPGGVRGCIVAAGSGVPRLDFEKQRWLEGPKFWAAIEDMPPGPGELAREIGIEGYEIELADGNRWRVPLIRRWTGSEHAVNLPKVLVPASAGGGVSFQVREEFAPIDALAARILSGFLNRETISMERLLEDASAILAVNYRVGALDAGLLGIFTEELAVKVLALCVDLPRLEAHAQRAAMEGVVFTEPVIQEESDAEG